MPDSLYGKGRDLQRSRAKWFRNFEAWNDLSVGVVFSVDGTIYTPHSNDQRVWVHEYGSPNSQAQAILGGATVQEGSPVKLMRYPKDPMLWQIVGTYLGGINPSIRQPVEESEVGIHGTNHQMPTEATKGIDPVDIWPPALQMLKTTGDNATLLVLTKGLIYYENDVDTVFPGAFTDLTSHVPGANLKRAVLLHLDPATNVIVVTNGSTVADIPSITPPVPDATIGTYPSALVILSNGQTAVNTINHVRDKRTFNSRSGSILSWLDLTDTDPTTYAAQAGLLVRVNSTPDGLEFVDHEDLTAIHIAHNYIYADAATRTGASGFVSADRGKIAWQTDDDSFWVLIATTPTWAEITGGAGASTWLDLTDTDPATYAGQAGQLVAVNSAPDGLEFITPPAGDFLNLTDVDPSTYAGQAGRVVAVNATPDGLEFIDAPAAGGDHLVEDSATSTPSIAVTSGHDTSGTPATGFGTRSSFEGETTTTIGTLMGALTFLWRTATHASRQAAFSLGLYRIAELIEVMRIEPSDVGTSSAPNARGAGAVEIQTFRDNVDQVASGDYAAILGGQLNLASGDGSVVAGGEENNAEGEYAGTLGGWLNFAEGDNSVVLGGILSAVSPDANHGVILAGAGSAVLAQSGIALGYQTRADVQGMLAHADTNFATVGDAETVRLNLHLAQAAHTSTTWYELFINGSSVRFTINADTVYTVKVIITGATSGMAQTWGYKIDAVIRNAGGTTTIDATAVVPIFESDAAYDARLTADDTNDALLVEVSRTGGTDYSIRWHAAITAGRVGFP